jgi:peptide/nickel transport system substrate-binding protein
MVRIVDLLILASLCAGQARSETEIGWGQNSSGAAAPRSAPSAKYGEAPELARLVAQNQLPAVENRLPRNPLLVQPVQRVGQYGGTWHSAFMGPSDSSWINRILGYEPLVRWDPEWPRIIPNLAEYYQVNAQATEFTFRLRQGLRWSDGSPFSADDILFWYEGVFCDPELHLGAAPWL